MNTWINEGSKEVYKIICSTHPMDLYDFLADSGAEPHTGEILSQDKLINLAFTFVLDNGSDIFFEWIMQQEGIN